MKGIAKVFCIIGAIMAVAAAVAAFLHFTGRLCCCNCCGDDCCGDDCCGDDCCGDDCCGCSDEEDSIFEK